MTEAELQRHMLQAATLYGWRRRYHTHDARKSAKGFPDWVMVRVPRVIYVELKGDSNRYGVTPEQQDWLDDLRACGQEAYVWTPADIPEMLKVLSRDWSPK